MNSSTRWGMLVAASLVALPTACEPPPPAVPAAPPPPPPEALPVASTAPADAAPKVKLTALTPLFESLSSENAKPVMGLAVGRRNNAGMINKQVTPYGRGEMTLMTYRRWGGLPLCPVQRAEGCSSFSISTSDKSPDEAQWLLGNVEGSTQAQKTSGLQAADHEWVHLVGGRDGVYGLRKGGKVDFISDQGKVALFAEDDEFKTWSKLWVIEVGERVYLAGGASGEGGLAWRIAEAVAAKDGPRKMASFHTMPMGPMPEFRQNAQGARSVSHGEQMAMFGAPQLFRLADEGEAKDRWAMAWLEVIPPPFGWPAGKPFKPGDKAAPGKPGPPAAKSSKKGAKNGCGGPASRSLDDKSVFKRAHVTVFSGDKVASDTIAWGSSDVNPYGLKLQASLDKGKVVVAPPPKPAARGKKGEAQASPARYPSPRGGGSEPLVMSPDESIEASAFDEASGEGVVLAHVNEQPTLRRFDASGKPVGEPQPIQAQLRESTTSLDRIGSHWYRTTMYPPSVARVTGEFKQTDLPQQHRPLGVAPDASGKPQVFTVREGMVWKFSINEQGEREGDPVKIAQIPEKTSEHAVFSVRLKGAPLLVAIESDRAEDGSFQIFTAPAVEGATWSTLKSEGGDFSPYNGHPRAVFGDVVLTFNDSAKVRTLWLSSKTWSDFDIGGYMTNLEFDQRPGALFSAQRESYDGGRYSRDRVPMLLPAAPGKATEAPELSFAHEGCSAAYATSASTMVLVCSEPVDKLKPGARIGLRTFRRDL